MALTTMDPAVLARYAALRKEVEQANFEYHNAAGSTLSDAEYDEKMRELEVLEAQHPEFAKDSISKRVGAKSTGPKVKHLRKMLSLDNVFTPDEANNHFKSSADKVWEPKIDGLSLSLVYKFGRLERATTRGDGVEGDDVTHNALVIPTIPKMIKFAPAELEVRGEVVIFKDDFQALVDTMKAEGDEPFANARNAAAGSLKLKDSAEAAKRKLSFVAYQAFGLADDVPTHTAMIGRLAAFGFNTPNRWWSLNDPFQTFTQELADKADEERKKMPFETDGVVAKVNSLKLRQEMGDGTKSPRWAVAYKFAPEEGVSVLEAVELPIGRTGVITPVAVLSPVLLNGATVRRASLCNWDEIARLDIAVGDEVVVVRAAEVIPKVIRVHKKHEKRREIAMPTSCPCCGGPILKDDEVVAIRCTNLNCTEQVFQRLSHAVAKTSLDWDGCGDAQIAELMSKGKCRFLSDFFAIQDVSWMGSAAKTKFLAERDRVKGVPLWRKLHSLGLEGIGKTFCQELAVKYGDLLKMLDDRAGVVTIVGPNRADKMFAQIDLLAEEIGRLDELGFKFVEVQTDKRQTKATGKQFVITGTLTTGSRDKVSERIEQAGGIVKSSVSAKTDYLVVGEDPGGNKTAGAKKHGTKVITEDELYTILELDPNNLPSDPLANVNIDDL
jgi:DNA ligase (NAD+)